jgi:hypothetical protein
MYEHTLSTTFAHIQTHQTELQKQAHILTCTSNMYICACLFLNSPSYHSLFPFFFFFDYPFISLSITHISTLLSLKHFEYYISLVFLCSFFFFNVFLKNEEKPIWCQGIWGLLSVPTPMLPA